MGRCKKARLNKENRTWDMDGRNTHLDSLLQGLAVDPLVLLLDVAHVNLTAGHHQADESPVVGAHPSHGVVQLLGKVRSPVLNAVVCEGQKRV